MKRVHFLCVYNKRMLCEHDCVKFCRHFAWHSFLENDFAEFLDEVRAKINQDFVHSLVAFRYSNICYCVALTWRGGRSSFPSSLILWDELLIFASSWDAWQASSTMLITWTSSWLSPCINKINISRTRQMRIKEKKKVKNMDSQCQLFIPVKALKSILKPSQWFHIEGALTFFKKLIFCICL